MKDLALIRIFEFFQANYASLERVQRSLTNDLPLNILISN